MEQNVNLCLLLSIISSLLGMFIFGYNTGVINAPEMIIRKFINETYEQRYNMTIDQPTLKNIWGFIVSIFAIGGMIGGLAAGYLANKFGRKKGLLLSTVLCIAGGLIMALSKTARSYEMLMIGRFVIGINCGLYTGLCFMYASELSPTSIRGGLGVLNQLGVTVALLISQVLGLNEILGSEENWPILLGLTIVPGVLQMLSLPFCPESPRYLLITKKMPEEAYAALRRLRKKNTMKEELDAMQLEEENQSKEPLVGITKMLTTPGLRMSLLVIIIMQLSQQLSGINAVFYYSVSLFVSADLTEDDAKYANMGVGGVMVLMTLISIPLMDRLGRRILHLTGLGGMFIFAILITISINVKSYVSQFAYVSVFAVIAYVIFFAVGPGSVPWILIPELFSYGSRPLATAIAVCTNWTANFIVGMVFPQLKEGLLQDYSFIPFIVLLALFWVFTFYKLPETKNKSFDEIALHFNMIS